MLLLCTHGPIAGRVSMQAYTRFFNSGPFLRLQPAKEETVDSPGERLDMTKIDEGVWAEAARGLPHVEKGAPECSRPGLNKPLLAHQVQGLKWMLSKESTDQGGILADDMGLGKTLQMISLAVETLLDVPTDSLGTINTTLVVAPASLIYQWADEICAHTSEGTLKALVYHGDNRAQYRNRFAEYDVVIVSYNTLSSEFALCIDNKENVDPDSQSKEDAACESESAVHAVRWKRVILDEAHLAKNGDTNRTRAVFALQSTLRWGCTGTPVQNSTRELYAFFHFLGLFKDITQWNREIEQGEDGLQKLKKLLATHVLRRTKQSRDRNDDKIVDLLDRVYHTDEIDLYPREKRIYKKIVRTYKKQARDGDERSTSMLVGVGRMRQACCHPKLLLGDKNLGLTKEQCNIDSAKIDFAAGLLRAIPDGEKAIVVCEFPEALRILAQKFPGKRFALIDGKMKPKEKAAVCREFNRTGSNLDGILLSLRAGGVGLNLTGANHVIHLNCHWNPTVDDQASDRAYRVGQTRQVHVHLIKTKGTIEERIWALQAEKRELAESLLRPVMQLRESTEEAFPEDVLTRLFAEEEEGEEEEEEEWEDVSDEGEQSEGEPMDISM